MKSVTLILIIVSSVQAWEWIGDEHDENVQCVGNIRYGEGENWYYEWDMEGYRDCTNEQWGDPIIGTVKKC